MAQTLEEICNEALRAVDAFDTALADLSGAISDLACFDTQKDEKRNHYISDQLGDPLEDVIGRIENEEPEADSADYLMELIERLHYAISDAETAMEEDKEAGLL